MISTGSNMAIAVKATARSRPLVRIASCIGDRRTRSDRRRTVSNAISGVALTCMVVPCMICLAIRIEGVPGLLPGQAQNA